MASLKEKYGDEVKFYFVEYNQAEAKPVIEKFNIQKHPETFILDENDELIKKFAGFDQQIEYQLKNTIKNLAK